MFGCCCTHDSDEFEIVGSMPVEAGEHLRGMRLVSEDGTCSQDVPRDYEATLKRQAKDETWGLTVEVLPEIGVFISSLTEHGTGPLPNYNKGASEEQRMNVLDRIISVNGAVTPEGICKAFKSGTELTMSMRRPRIFEQTIAANGKPLGMALINLQGGNGLFVQALASDSYIAKCGADIVSGDRIIKVNDRGGKPKDMLAELKSTKPVVLTIARA